MGFKDTDAALLAGLFGQALYDVVYPKWWGGQGKASEMPVTAKVNEQIYRPGSNYAGGIRGSSWQRSMGAEIESTIPKGVRPKERVDVTQMTPAGMHSSYKPRTGGPKKRGDPYNLDPDNAFCGAGNAININIQNPKFARPKLKGPTASYLQDSINYPIIENPANCKSRIRDIIQEDYREYKMKHKEMEGLSEDEERENSRGEINEDKSKPATSLSIKRSQGFAEDENKSPSKKVVKKVIRKKITGQATDTEGMSPDEIDGTDRDINSPAYKNRKGARAANENLRSKNKANQDTTSPNVTDPEPQSTPEAGGAKNDGKFFGGRKPAANAGGQKADMIAGGLLLPVRKDSLDRSQDNTNLDGGFGQSRGPGYAKGFGNNTNKQLNPEQESRNVNPGNDQRPAGWIGQREVGKEAGRPQINSNIPSIRPTAHSFDENQEGLLDTEGREDIKKFAKMLDNNRSSDPQAVRGNINKANSRQSGNVGGSYKQDEPIDDFQGNDDQNNPARIDTNISGSYSLKRKDDVADLDQDSFRNNLADSGSIGMDSLDKTPKSQNPGDRRQELVPKRSSKTNEQLQVTGAQENSRNNRSGLAPSKGKEASLSKDGSLKSATPKSNNLGKQSSVSSKSGNRQSEPSPYFGGKQRSSSRGILSMI